MKHMQIANNINKVFAYLGWWFHCAVKHAT